MFWLVCGVITAATLALVLTPILRPPTGQNERPELALFKAQLAEVDRDVARQIVPASEAERVKAEIGRRLIAASKAAAEMSSGGPKATGVVAAAAVCVCVIAGGTYLSIGAPGMTDLPLQTRINQAAETRATRPSQLTAEASSRVLSAPEFSADYIASVESLRRLVPERGDDLQGWELLAYHEARLRNFSAAAMAQGRVVSIKGSAASPDDLLRHADLLVAAADGYVSPEAETVVRKVLETAPNSVAARYYLGAMFDQTDRPDIAFRLWQSIVESGAPESLYENLARQQIAGAAFRAGITYTAPPPATTTVLPGPSADDMAAATDMTDADRAAMIENMVSGLAERLATDGGPPAEWARLITAYGVLGRTDEARNILSEARTVFQESFEALALFAQAEESLMAAE